MSRTLLTWIGVGALLALIGPVTIGALAYFAAMLWAVTGLTLLAAAIWRARKPQGRAMHVLLALGVFGAWLLFLPTAWLGNALTGRIRFALERSRYEQIVARELATSADGGLRQAESYNVDPGPPVRIAFIWPGGFGDNWCGAVYDPSGDVVAFDDFLGDGEEPEPRVTGLFGAKLVWCKELEAPYYRCCFT